MILVLEERAGGNDADLKGKRPWGSGHGNLGGGGSGSGNDGGVDITADEMKASYLAGVCQYCASRDHQKKDLISEENIDLSSRAASC